VINNILAGGALGQLVFAVLGVLVMTSEYSSGTIRATLAAIPRRPLVLAAKTAVFGVVALVTGEAATFAGFLAGTASSWAGLGIIACYAVVLLAVAGWLLSSRDA